ncbi:MAG: hypothetical protein EHM58_04465 [Ignavibacteriae bacterium]|nr:MAG: hypothetical protein EHM58_04465 [Ignavibacteriota bacterium]
MLLKGLYPNLTKQYYNGDYAYFFDLSNGEHGYTYDKETYHVYKESNNSYESMSKSELENYINGKNNINNNNNITSIKNLNYQYDTQPNKKSGTNNTNDYLYLALGLAGVGVLLLLINKF